MARDPDPPERPRHHGHEGRRVQVLLRDSLDVRRRDGPDGFGPSQQAVRAAPTHMLDGEGLARTGRELERPLPYRPEQPAFGAGDLGFGHRLVRIVHVPRLVQAVVDPETSWARSPWPTRWPSATPTRSNSLLRHPDSAWSPMIPSSRASQHLRAVTH